MIRGKVHEYLEMTLDYTVRGQARITMLSYNEEIIAAFNREYSKGKGKKSSDAPNNIFVINEDCKKLDQEKVVEFQNLASNTLYATKREIPYTCKAIAFMTTRLRAPDEDDWDKLVHLM